MRYDAILQVDPRNAPALHYSGVVLLQAGEARRGDRTHSSVDRHRCRIARRVVESCARAGGRESPRSGRQRAEGGRRSLHRIAPEIWTNLAASELALRRERDAEASARRALAVDASVRRRVAQPRVRASAQGRALEALDAASRASGLVPERPCHSPATRRNSSSPSERPTPRRRR